MARVLIVVNGHRYTAAHRVPLLEGAESAGYEVVCAVPEGSPALQLLEASGWPCYSLKLSRRGCNPWAELEAIRELVRTYRFVRPDIVHHATIKPILYGSAAARQCNVPAVVNAVTGLGYVYVNRSLRAGMLRSIVNPFYRYAFGHPNQRVIFQNRHDWESLERTGAVRPGQAVLIPGSGVDLKRFSVTSEPGGTPLVILPARMIWDKGVGEFVKAARKLRAKGLGCRFALVGGLDLGNPSAVSECQLRAWVNSGAVEWWGAQEDMVSVYQAASLVVLPSYGEGLPKVLIEAAACGRAVVTADTPGCRDAIEEGVSGRLVPPGDSDRLAECILELLNEPVLRKQMGVEGRRIAEERFSKERVVAATLQVYEELHAMSKQLK